MPTEAPLTPQRSAGWEEDPLVGFNFSLEIGGGLVGYFTECSGIGSEHDVVEKQFVDKNGHSFVRKVPGLLKYNNVTMTLFLLKFPVPHHHNPPLTPDNPRAIILRQFPRIRNFLAV